MRSCGQKDCPCGAYGKKPHKISKYFRYTSQWDKFFMRANKWIRKRGRKIAQKYGYKEEKNEV